MRCEGQNFCCLRSLKFSFWPFFWREISEKVPNPGVGFLTIASSETRVFDMKACSTKSA